MWQTQHTQITAADAETVWGFYTDVIGWPTWDPGCEKVTLDGPFQVGVSGTLTPASGPKAKFVMLEVTAGRSFTDETTLPGARMRFAHILEPLPAGGTRLTHRVTIEGPMTWLFSRVIGKGISRELPIAMRALADLADRAVIGPGA